MIGHRSCGGHVVGHHDNGIQIVHVGDLGDQLAGLFKHDQVKAGKRLVHQQKVLAAQNLLNDGAPLPLPAR